MKAKILAKPEQVFFDFNQDWDIPVPILNAYLPAMAHVLLRQHSGSSSRLVVKPGDLVREGMTVGVPVSEDSAFIHSPIPGEVRSIRSVRLPDGGSCESIEVFLRGSFERIGKRSERYVWESMRRQDIIQVLREKGVVETNGQGRSMAQALQQRTCSEIAVLGADDEPYVQTEVAVLRNRTLDLLEGIKILARILEARTASIYSDAKEMRIHSQQEALILAESKGKLNFELKKHPNQYLHGPLTRRASGQEGGENGVFSVVPSTLVAIFEAVVQAKPFVERYVTVAGGAIKRPTVLKARIGTPIGDLIEECGGFQGVPERLVLGGPFTGLPAKDLDVPITKATGAVLALLPAETRRGQVRPCIRCGRCAESCPVDIDPEMIWRHIEIGRLSEARELGLDRCLSCGLCSYVCPSRIPLSQGFSALGKGQSQ